MEISSDNSVKLAVCLGAIAGMRAMAAPAVLSHYLSRQPDSGLVNTNLEFVRTVVFDNAAKLLTVGEVFGDKLPQTPNRIAIVPLLGRAISGAFTGAAIFRHNRQNAWRGVLIGGVSSLASSFLFYYLRKNLGDKAHIQDKLLGFAEDALAIGSGVAVMNGKKH